MMIKKAIFLFFLSFFLLMFISSVTADERTDNIEIYLVLDKSLSMVEELDSVKEYVIDNIIDRVVVPGDYFLLIPFYGHTDKSFNGYLSSSVKITDLKKEIENLQPDGRFTDIGNALNTLRDNIKPSDKSIRKYMLLITDGKQEAPPDSPFYSPDGSFNHEFLKNTKEIQKKGWKIVVLGVGTESAAEKIAEELSAGYSEVSKNADSAEINNAINNFLGRLELISFNDQIKTGRNGKATINLKIKSSGYGNTKNIRIIAIQLVTDGLKDFNILKAPYSFNVGPESVSNVEVPVVFPSKQENYKANIIFVFEGKNAFTPAVHQVFVKSSQRYLYILYLLIIAVVIFIIVFYSIRIWQRKKMENDENKQKRSVH